MFKQTRPFAVARRFLAAPTVALTLIIAGLAAIAPAASAGIPGCSWQPLTLMNGWQSGHGFGTGDPSWCGTGDGMVYLSGSITAPNGATGGEFAALPASAAPAHTDYLNVYTVNGAAGTLWITPDGGLHTFGGSAQQFTSLAGVSFPSVTASEQSLMPLLNGWQSAQGKYGTGDPAYLVSNGAVHLDGSFYNPNGSPATFSLGPWTSAVLPPSVPEPSGLCFLTNVYTFGGNPGQLAIFNWDGEINGGNGDFTSLAGLTYPANPANWQAITNVAGTNWCNVPDASVKSNVVYLQGGWTLPAGFNGEFAVLPASARPAHTLYLITHADAPGSDLTYVALRIDPNGAMNAFSGQNGGSELDLTLMGLSYQRLS
jgi:hypothetical protein